MKPEAPRAAAPICPYPHRTVAQMDALAKLGAIQRLARCFPEGIPNPNKAA